MNHLLLFDFDGTITKRDTLLAIARFSTHFFKFYIKMGLLTPVMVIMKLKVIRAQKGKKLFLKLFFGSYATNEFGELCQNFIKTKLPDLVRPLAEAEIRNQVAKGNRVVIVSASPESWIKPWAEPLGVEVIATKLKFENDKLKSIDGVNCNGEEKVKRIKAEINLKDYDKVIAYGDTKGDLPMLALADEKHYKPFR